MNSDTFSSAHMKRTLCHRLSMVPKDFLPFPWGRSRNVRKAAGALIAVYTTSRVTLRLNLRPALLLPDQQGSPHPSQPVNQRFVPLPGRPRGQRSPGPREGPRVNPQNRPRSHSQHLLLFLIQPAALRENVCRTSLKIATSPQTTSPTAARRLVSGARSRGSKSSPIFVSELAQKNSPQKLVYQYLPIAKIFSFADAAKQRSSRANEKEEMSKSTHALEFARNMNKNMDA